MDSQKRIKLSSEFRMLKECQDKEFVPVKRFREAVIALKQREKICDELETVYEEQHERADKMLEVAKKLRAELEAGKTHFGRNQMKKSDRDAFDHVNVNNIMEFMKDMFRIKKFLHHSWSYWLPLDKRSFCAKILDQLDMPTDMEPEWFWHKKIVPLINSKMCDIRSEATKAIQKAYLSKWRSPDVSMYIV